MTAPSTKAIAEQLEERPELLAFFQTLLGEATYPDDDDLVTVPEAAKERGRSVASHYRDVAEGRFPPPFKVGPRSVRYRRKTIRLAMEQLEGAA